MEELTFTIAKNNKHVNFWSLIYVCMNAYPDRMSFLPVIAIVDIVFVIVLVLLDKANRGGL